MYKRYENNSFLLFSSVEHVENIYTEQKQHKIFTCTSQIEENGSLSFLGVKIIPKNNKFITSIHGKRTFTGVFSNFKSLFLNLLHTV